MRAHWRHLANTIKLVLPSAHSSPQPRQQNDQPFFYSSLQSGPLKPTWVQNPNGISIGSAVHAQCTADSPYTLQWALAPKLPISIGDLDPHPSNTQFPGWATPFPKNALHMGDVDPLSNTWFLGSTRVLDPNGILIVSAIFTGLTTVTDQQSDHSTRCGTIGCIYVHSTAMRPNKYWTEWWCAGVVPTGQSCRSVSLRLSASEFSMLRRTLLMGKSTWFRWNATNQNL